MRWADAYDQAEHDQHDRLLAQRERIVQQVPQFLQEQQHVHALRDDQAEIERKLQQADATRRDLIWVLAPYAS